MSTTAIVLGSALGSAAFGMVSGLFQSSNTRKSTQAAIDAQNSANQTNIQLQREQNAWNAEQIEKQNEYNSPVNQRLRNESAGINPLFADIEPGLQNVAASGTAPRVDSAAPLLLSAAEMKNQAINNMFDNSLKSAQTALTMAQSQKVNKETSWVDRLNQGSVDLMHSQGVLNTDTSSWTKQQIKQSEHLCNEIDARINNLRESTLNLIDTRRNLLIEYDNLLKQGKLTEEQTIAVRHQIKLMQIDEIYKSSHYQALINDLQARAGLSAAEARLVGEQIVTQSLGNASLRMDVQTKYFNFDTNLDSASTLAKFTNWQIHQTDNWKQFNFNVEKTKQIADCIHTFNVGLVDFFSLGNAPLRGIMKPITGDKGLGDVMNMPSMLYW